jgi:hypothetical protein
LAFLGDVGKFFGLGSSKEVLSDIGGAIGGTIGGTKGAFIGSKLGGAVGQAMFHQQARRIKHWSKAPSLLATQDPDRKKHQVTLALRAQWVIQRKLLSIHSLSHKDCVA